ncbi:MAG: MFS transporter [Deltaproteobacteria bacterium]|nr:MFS transporter [Deltaproteobacteria bacterium]
MPDQARPSFWTRTFILLSASQFLAYGHHAVLTPTLPLYLDHLGSSPFMVGLLLACFSATSIVIRPLVGTWVDSGGELRVLSLSCIGLCLTVLIFVVPNVEGAFTANVLRGFAWAGINTSGYALLAAVVPTDRRGEASGYYSGIQSSASLFFPPAALWIIGLPAGGYAAVFALSSAVALFAAALAQVCGRGVKQEPSPPAAPPGPAPPAAGGGTAGGRLRTYSRTYFDRGILFIALLLFCMNLPWSGLNSFIVLYAREVGIESLGWYFAAIGLASVVGRPLLGRVSDRLGRAPAVAASYVLEIAGVALVLLASDITLMAVAGALYFFGYALGVSTTLALAMERGDPKRRGVTMATFSIAFPLGSGLGSALSGGVIALAGYRGMYMSLIGVLATGLLLSLCYRGGLTVQPRTGA